MYDMTSYSSLSQHDSIIYKTTCSILIGSTYHGIFVLFIESEVQILTTQLLPVHSAGLLTLLSRILVLITVRVARLMVGVWSAMAKSHVFKCRKEFNTSRLGSPRVDPGVEDTSDGAMDSATHFSFKERGLELAKA